MLEWLSRDPLNGLVMTVAFFGSLIIGRYIGEKREKVFQMSWNLDTRIRLLVAFSLIIAVTLMKHWYFPLIISVSCIVIAQKLHIFRAHCKNLVFPFVLALFIFAVQGLTYGAGRIGQGTIPVYAEGVGYGSLIFARVLASASVLVLLVLTTSRNDILDSMRWFRVPGTIIDISSFMARYIKAFSQEGKKLRLAQESRCGPGRRAGFLNSMKNIASICGALITRAFERSEEVYSAMLARAWLPGSRYSTDVQPLSKSDMISGAILFLGIIGLVGLDMFV